MFEAWNPPAAPEGILDAPVTASNWTAKVAAAASRNLVVASHEFTGYDVPELSFHLERGIECCLKNGDAGPLIASRPSFTAYVPSLRSLACCYLTSGTRMGSGRTSPSQRRRRYMRSWGNGLEAETYTYLADRVYSLENVEYFSPVRDDLLSLSVSRPEMQDELDVNKLFTFAVYGAIAAFTVAHLFTIPDGLSAVLLQVALNGNLDCLTEDFCRRISNEAVEDVLRWRAFGHRGNIARDPHMRAYYATYEPNAQVSPRSIEFAYWTDRFTR